MFKGYGKFAWNNGQGYSDNNMNLYLEKIQLQIDKLEKEKDEKCRLYKTVATMFGLLIVITII